MVKPSIGRKLAFVHIHKTAGTTLHDVIYHQLGRIAFHPRYAESDFPLLRDGREFMKKFPRLDTDMQRTYIEELRHFNAIGGHTPFGIHNLFSDDFDHVTVLRNPWDRFVSYYHHHLNPRNPNQRQHFERIRNLPLEDYCKVQEIRPMIDNRSIRMLARVPSKLSVERQHLDRAVENLQSFRWILFQHALAAGIDQLAVDLQWREVSIPALKLSETGERHSEVYDELSSTQREAIYPLIKYELDLYSHALNLDSSISKPNSPLQRTIQTSATKRITHKGL
ncbi:MAG: sulfotransferase family 2 domain-containing protein [Pseudomonadota bacterium]